MNFDRAVSFYDQTRSLPRSLADKETQLLLDHIDGRALEIGAGTGRVAVPLLENGIDVVGLDVSIPMLQRYREKTKGALLVGADATGLPFATRSFETVIACHVLHLIPNWTDALAEVNRVLKRAGVLLAVRGGWGEHRRQVSRWFFDEAGTRGTVPGAVSMKEVDDHLTTQGWGVCLLPEIAAPRWLDLLAYIDQLEEGVFSATWNIGAAARTRAARHTRRRVRDRYGQETVLEEIHTIRWRKYTTPNSLI